MRAYPIFRLAIPMAAGIFFEETFRVELGYLPVLVLLLLLFLLGFFLKNRSYGKRWSFGVGVFVFMFLFGWMLTEYAWKEVKVNWKTGNQVYRGMMLEELQEKKRSFQCRVEVMGKDVLLYLPKDSCSSALTVGASLLFYAEISSPRNAADFQSFDYARYLYHDGVSGTAYVPAHAWKEVESKGELGLKQKALSLRSEIMNKYHEWGIGEKQLPVLSALTLGYKGDLDEETRKAYSIAGISHVLALSGMHIGILWLLLNMIFRPLVHKRLLWVRWVLVSPVLWGFAFLVGLEASVVRAVFMCMLMELGKSFGARPFSMNTLCVAAFFMLMYNPFYLFDVGFQLSFVAVASILILFPLFFSCFSIRNVIGKWAWGMMSVSLAAQLGTAPLVMYYFSNFSVYFLLANVMVAIGVPFILYGALLMVLLAPFPAFQVWVVKTLNVLVAGMNGIAAWTSNLPYASFSLSVWKPVEVILFYGLMVCAVMYWKKKSRIWFISGLFACVCLLGTHFFLIFFGHK